MHQGKVLATEEVFHVVDVPVMTLRGGYGDFAGPIYASFAQCLNSYGQWGSFFRVSSTEYRPQYGPKLVTVKKAGWFSPGERVFRVSWSEKPPQPELHDVLKRAAELLAPAA